MTPEREAAEIASGWWGRVIQNPKFDNGDDSEMGHMASMMASLASQPATSEQAMLFQVNIALAMEAALMVPSNRDPYVCVGCDYGPGKLLGDAAEAAGISYRAFPWKTNMNLSAAGGVKVSYGYGAGWQTLMEPWATKEAQA